MAPGGLGSAGAGPVVPRYEAKYLEPDDHDHVRRLMARWGMLADLSFSDLLMYRRAPESGFVVAGHVRATTSPTLYIEDRVGEVYTDTEVPLVVKAFDTGRIAKGSHFAPSSGRVNAEVIPVRRGHRTLAVMAREHGPMAGREHGDLEKRYLQVFDRLTQMITTGEFPFPADSESPLAGNPRVGDGVAILDAVGTVQYVSPNAVSALNRSGVITSVKGRTLQDAGLEQMATRMAFRTKLPTSDETTLGEVTLALRVVPLLVHGEVTGGLVLIQDVTELRTRDRLLLSKDATIREVHHRVKNNLQTISSLLRLQGRRLSEPSAVAAINESVQRIRAIAVVHELLSIEHTDEVHFTDIARQIVRMMDEITGTPVRVSVSGEAGLVPAAVATPLAVVINELVQNAVDHAFGGPPNGDEPSGDNRVEVGLHREGDMLTIDVVDNGVGITAASSTEAGTANHRPGLGMSIVHSLVESELSGEISTSEADPGSDRPGTRARLQVTVVARDDLGRPLE